MGALERYRDDGPIAAALSRVLPQGTGPLGPALTGTFGLALALGIERGPTAWTALAIGGFVVLGAAGRGHPLAGRLDWFVPVLLRAAELATVLMLAAATGRSAVPAAYAFLGAAAFRQYDVVYRLRHQRAVPPETIGRLGGGWDGRMTLAFILARAGVLDVGLAVGAVWLAMLFVADSAASWVRASALPPGEEMSIEAGGD